MNDDYLIAIRSAGSSANIHNVDSEVALTAVTRSGWLETAGEDSG